MQVGLADAVGASDEPRTRRANAGRRSHRRVVLGVIGAVVLVGATAAVADVSVTGSDGGSTIGVAVGTSGSGAGGSAPGYSQSSAGGQPVCLYTDTGRGLLYMVSCSGLSVGLGGSGPVLELATPTSASPGAGTDPIAVAAAAEDAIGLPSPSLRFDPMPFTVTGIATWMWLDASMWHSYSASASVGTVTATAIASPVSVSWIMGDGAVVTCEGPGTAYRPDVPAAEQSSSCSHVYRVSSAGQPSAGTSNDAAFPVTAVVTWFVSWSSSVGAGGSLPPLQTRSTTALRVEQVQSVDTVH